jgi:ATP-dependent DNA helicase PIF1
MRLADSAQDDSANDEDLDNFAGSNYADYLLKIGQGADEIAVERVSPYSTIIQVPHPLRPEDPTMEGLIAEIFPDFGANCTDHEYIAERVILAPTNHQVDRINNVIASAVPAPGPLDQRVYSSVDRLEEDMPDPALFPVEFLNSLSVNGMAPHELHLKKGMVVMVLRNLRTEGLANGSRVIITNLLDNVVQAEVASGQSKGQIVYLHRIDMSSADSTLPFKFIRRQFPIKPCYAMTINKSQGQSIKFVGVCLEEQVFCHGQLYVALSRVKDPRCIKVLAPDNLMRNVVFPALLRNDATNP